MKPMTAARTRKMPIKVGAHFRDLPFAADIVSPEDRVGSVAGHEFHSVFLDLGFLIRVLDCTATQIVEDEVRHFDRRDDAFEESVMASEFGAGDGRPGAVHMPKENPFAVGAFTIVDFLLPLEHFNHVSPNWQVATALVLGRLRTNLDDPF